MFIIVWLIFCVVVGVIAANSCGRSGIGWFFFSFLFSPLIALLFLAVAGKKYPKGNTCNLTP